MDSRSVQSSSGDSMPEGEPGIDILNSDLESEVTLWDLYERWMTHYQVSRSLEEKVRRFGFFKEQVNFVHANNNIDKSYELGLNDFSNWSKDEFEPVFVGGTSWILAALKTIESVIFLRTGIDTEISEQKVIDGCYRRSFCTSSGIGGDVRKVLMNREFETIDGNVLIIDGYEDIPCNDEEALKEVVRRQPVVAVIDARGDAFRNYKGGIFTEEFGKEPNQSVMIFGCDVTSDGEKYWEIHISWGTKWGEGGFMRKKRGVNLCGIASNAVYPIKNSTNLTPPRSSL